MDWKISRNTKENGEDLDEFDLYEGNTVLYENEGKTYDVKIILKTGMYKCDLASENRPYDIFNPNGVISIML